MDNQPPAEDVQRELEERKMEKTRPEQELQTEAEGASEIKIFSADEVREKIGELLDAKRNTDGAEMQKYIEEKEGRKVEKIEMIEGGGMKVTFGVPESATIEESAEPAPKTPEEIGVMEEINNLPEEEKKKLAIGLNTIGFVVEKKKNDFFAGALGLIAKKIDDKKGTSARFVEELRNSFVRDSENAKKKAEEVASGKEKHGFSNAGLLFGNVVRYGRIITDLTGKSLASPLRYVMMGGMVFTRASEAAKEARLKNEEVIEKTRIDDADRAAEEAWKIYDNARRQEGKTGDENISAEALKNAYLMNMPEDIYKRLENTSTANSFLQKVLRKDFKLGMNYIINSMDKIQNNPKLFILEKEIATRKLIKKHEKRLRDYDRILTQYGTVDELAMAGRYAQTLGKTVVATVTVETLILSVEKLYETVSHVLTSHDIHPIEATGKFVKHIFQRNEKAKMPTLNTSSPVVSHLGTSHVGTLATADTSHIAPPAASAGPVSSIHENLKINPDAVVHQGEGVEHTLIRQIEHNPKLAQELGFKGDVNDAKALHAFAGSKADVIARETGYVGKDGHQIQITEANKVSFELRAENGHGVVTEKTIDGKILGTYHKGDEFGANPKNQYEYEKVVDPTHHGTIHPGAEENLKTLTPMEAGETSQGNLATNFIRQVENDPDLAQKLGFTGNINDSQALHAFAVEKALNAAGYTHTNVVDVLRTQIHQKIDLANKPSVGNIVNQGDAQIPLSGPSLSDIPSLFTHHNPYHLVPDKLIQVYETYQRNIAHYFPGDHLKDWADMKNLKTHAILNNPVYENNPHYQPLLNYIHMLKDNTGLKPKGWSIFHGAESSESYIVRALQKLLK